MKSGMYSIMRQTRLGLTNNTKQLKYFINHDNINIEIDMTSDITYVDERNYIKFNITPKHMINTFTGAYIHKGNHIVSHRDIMRYIIR